MRLLNAVLLLMVSPFWLAGAAFGAIQIAFWRGQGFSYNTWRRWME